MVSEGEVCARSGQMEAEQIAQGPSGEVALGYFIHRGVFPALDLASRKKDPTENKRPVGFVS